MFREVPVLPAVVPIAVAVLGFMIWTLHRRGRLSPARAAVAVVLCVYVAGVVANTVFPIYLDKPARSGVEWDTSLNLAPLAGYDAADAWMNVLVFVPVGVLVPLLLTQVTWWKVAGTAAAFSLMIEAAQLVAAFWLGGGHVADVNDLIFNVVGALLGFAVFSAVTRVPRVAGLVDRFRWR